MVSEECIHFLERRHETAHRPHRGEELKLPASRRHLLVFWCVVALTKYALGFSTSGNNEVPNVRIGSFPSPQQVDEWEQLRQAQLQQAIKAGGIPAILHHEQHQARPSPTPPPEHGKQARDDEDEDLDVMKDVQQLNTPPVDEVQSGQEAEDVNENVPNSQDVLYLNALPHGELPRPNGAEDFDDGVRSTEEGWPVKACCCYPSWCPQDTCPEAWCPVDTK